MVSNDLSLGKIELKEIILNNNTNFSELLKNHKFLQIEDLYEIATTIIKNYKEPSQINAVVRANEVLRSLKPRKTTGITGHLHKSQHRSVLARIEQILTSNFDQSLHVKSGITPEDKLVQKLNGHTEEIESFISSMGVGKEAWKELKKAVAQNKGHKAQNAWNKLLAEVRLKAGITSSQQAEDFLLNPIAFIHTQSKNPEQQKQLLLLLPRSYKKYFPALIHEKSDLIASTLKSISRSATKTYKKGFKKVKKLKEFMSDPLEAVLAKFKYHILNIKLEPLPISIDSPEFTEKLLRVERKIDKFIKHIDDDPWNHRLSLDHVSFLIEALRLGIPKGFSSENVSLDRLIVQDLHRIYNKLRSKNLIKIDARHWGSLRDKDLSKTIRQQGPLYTVGSKNIFNTTYLDYEISALLITPDCYPKPKPIITKERIHAVIDVTNVLFNDLEHSQIIPPEKLEHFIKYLFSSEPKEKDFKLRKNQTIAIEGMSIASTTELDKYMQTSIASMNMHTQLYKLRELIQDNNGNLEGILQKIENYKITKKEWDVLHDVLLNPTFRDTLKKMSESDSPEVQTLIKLSNSLRNFVESIASMSSIKTEVLANSLHGEVKDIVHFLEKLQLKHGKVDINAFTKDELDFFVNSVLPLIKTMTTTEWSEKYNSLHVHNIYDLIVLDRLLQKRFSSLVTPILDTKPVNDSFTTYMTTFKNVSIRQLSDKLDYLMEMKKKGLLDKVSKNDRLTLYELEFLKNHKNSPLKLTNAFTQKISDFRKAFFNNKEKDFIHLGFIQYKLLPEYLESNFIKKLYVRIAKYAHTSFKVAQTTPSKNGKSFLVSKNDQSIHTSISGKQYFNVKSRFRSHNTKEYKISLSTLSEGVPADLKKEFKDILKEKLLETLAEKRKVNIAEIRSKIPLKIFQDKFTLDSNIDLELIDFNEEMFCSEYCLTALVKATMAAYAEIKTLHSDRVSDFKPPENMSFFGFSKNQRPNRVSPRLLQESLKKRGIIKALPKKDFIPLKAFANV